jgi:ParB family transcriptional regulator, chromosome partitioning protein
MAKKSMNTEKRDYLKGISFGTSDHIPRVIEVAIENLAADPNQPRKNFVEAEIQSLANSIKEKGLLQPITVRHNGEREGHFIIVAGERRYRASKLAGLPSIGCIVTRGDHAEIALIENIQRVDLNPIETAEAIDALMKAHGYTHDTVAKVLGKSRSVITETLAVLKLSPELKDKCRTLDIGRVALNHISQMTTEGQGRALEHIDNEGTISARDAEAIKKGTGKELTPLKMATKAMYASVTRLSQMTGKLKVDEIKALKEAKRKLDEAYKLALARE